MAKKPQPQKEQMDAEDELLNFDLEELSGDESSAEDEVIELVELVEADQDEEKTRELPVRNRLKEKPSVKPAKEVKPAPVKAPAQAKNLPADDEEPELDLSDLTLDMDVEATRPQQPVGEDEITEADLENLLKETDSGEISFDLSAEEEGDREGKDEEVADADLEALLQEATIEEGVEEPEEEEVLEIVSETEAMEEVQLEEEKPSLTDIESIADSFEETQAVSGPLIEEAPLAVQAVLDRPKAEALVREEIPAGEPPMEQLAGISEERIEEILTKVVQEVVERVARETMASVAERVIGQAIEALKASMENSSEEI
jgi:S-DNA-T family DNA segregation ATPase FtsK/SpoIIIE